ncbi:GTPase [Stratiformator vulcanicus]|uniref:Translation-associated GTPase n=1 Tax=Stratiformator vulcanicus TaxID=2527980 RepID=A0A517QYT9_9PLAN|nr:GTPase [Stratiformator vulcanicus]QDT36815.1 translation-associated GTPase [Stratiformator vulcanicus]
MAANLTPQYRKAEAEYRRAAAPSEQATCLERMLQLIPKHKGTEKLQADIKSRLKEARADADVEKKAPKSHGPTYRFPRQGAGTIAVIGGPNAGKTRLVNALTGADRPVADYPFTTHEPAPAMMPWEDVTAQLIDTPPISDAPLPTYLLNLVRTADAVVLCFDGSSDDAPGDTQTLLRQFNARKTQLSKDGGIDEVDFSVIHVASLLAVTRGSDAEVDVRLELLKEVSPIDLPIIKVELDDPASVDAASEAIFASLHLIRVYPKTPGKPVDMKDPFTIPRGGTAEDVAAKVHRDLAEKLKFAKLWGGDGPDGRTVSCDHQLCDGDVIELHTS